MRPKKTTPTKQPESAPLPPFVDLEDTIERATKRAHKEICRLEALGRLTSDDVLDLQRLTKIVLDVRADEREHYPPGGEPASPDELRKVAGSPDLPEERE